MSLRRLEALTEPMDQLPSAAASLVVLVGRVCSSLAWLLHASPAFIAFMVRSGNLSCPTMANLCMIQASQCGSQATGPHVPCAGPLDVGPGCGVRPQPINTMALLAWSWVRLLQSLWISFNLSTQDCVELLRRSACSPSTWVTYSSQTIIAVEHHSGKFDVQKWPTYAYDASKANASVRLLGRVFLRQKLGSQAAQQANFQNASSRKVSNSYMDL